MIIPNLDNPTLNMLRYGEVIKSIERIRQYKRKDGKRTSVSDKIALLSKLETKAKQIGYPIADIKHEIERMEYKGMMIEELKKKMKRDTYFLTMSTLTHRGYTEKAIKDSFKVRLQQVNTGLFGGKWKQNGMMIRGVFVLESVNKRGHTICPHIHAIFGFPDIDIRNFSGSLHEIDYLFRNGVKLYEGEGTYQKPPKVVKDTYGNAVFSDVDVRPIDLSRIENLGEYFLKQVIRGDVVSNTSEETAGMYEFKGDQIVRIS